MSVLSRRSLLASALLAGLLPSAAFGQAKPAEIRIDWATYNPVSLLLKEKGLLEKEFAKDGIKVELVPLPGSTDCVKAVATKDVQYGLPSIEPLAIIRPQGVKIKNYYTYTDYSVTVNKDLGDSLVVSLAAVGTNKTNFFVLPGSGTKDLGKGGIVLGLKKTF